MKFDKLSSKIEKLMQPINNLVNYPFFSILQKAMYFTLPFTLVGSLYFIIRYFPLLSDYYPDFFINLFTAIYKPLYFFSTQLISILILLAIGYYYAEYKENPPLPGAVVSLISFLIVTPLTSNGDIDLYWLGSSGVFVSILIGFTSSIIYNKLLATNIKIKLHESIPPQIAISFTSFIPAMITFLSISVISYVCSLTPMNNIHNLIYTMVQKPLIGLGTTLGATIVCVIISQLCWWCGIHGGNVVLAVMQPIYLASLTANLNAIAAGNSPIYKMTYTFWFFFVPTYYLGLDIACIIFGKHEQIKSIGKLALPGQIFNVGEPSIFGLPIVGNPIMLIPTIFIPVVCTLIGWGAMAIGFMPLTNGVNIAWTTPIIISGYLVTDSLSGSIVQIIQLSVSVILCVPFIRMYDKQLDNQEEILSKNQSEEINKK